MLFNSFEFLIFFPVTILVYFIIPRKIRHIWLLFASYLFYINWSAIHALLLLFSTAVIYLSGIMMEQAEDKRTARVVVGFSFIINLAILFVFKYADMIPGISLELLPVVGISFYTFQALSYTMDVYRGEIKAEHNFLRYALFVSFFPQLVAGPIERSRNLLPQVNNLKDFDYDRARDGFYLMLWGFFLKICIADRVAVIVDAVYDAPDEYSAAMIGLATALFAIQIYCDFAGYSTIAVGAARILGFDLMRNFDAPYLSLSVTDFWKRWHISLTSWFRDYLYIPLGGSRCGTSRKMRNIMIVFLVSGLWHGASWHFVLWGGLNGLFQVLENLTGIRGRRKVNAAIALLRGIAVFVLIDLTWVFFRADSVSSAWRILVRLFTGAAGKNVIEGVTFRGAVFIGVAVVLLLVVDIFRRKGVDLQGRYSRLPMMPRCFLTALSANLIILFGMWGSGLSESAFIYFQF